MVYAKHLRVHFSNANLQPNISKVMETQSASISAELEEIESRISKLRYKLEDAAGIRDVVAQNTFSSELDKLNLRRSRLFEQQCKINSFEKAEDLRKTKKKEIQSAKESINSRISLLLSDSEQRFKALEDSHQKEIEEIAQKDLDSAYSDGYEQKIESAIHRHVAETEALKARMENEKKEIKAEEAADIKRIRNKFDRMIKLVFEGKEDGCQYSMEAKVPSDGKTKMISMPREKQKPKLARLANRNYKVPASAKFIMKCGQGRRLPRKASVMFDQGRAERRYAQLSFHYFTPETPVFCD